MFHCRFTFCCDEDQTPNITNIQSLKEIGLHLQMSTTTRHSTMNTTGTTYAPSWEINKHALMITITKSGEVWFSIRFFLQMMFRCRFVFCCGEDQSPKHHKHTRFQKRLDYIFKCQYITIRHWTLNTTGTTCAPNRELNKHALPITITKSGEVRFSIRFFCRWCFVVDLRFVVMKIKHQKITNTHDFKRD